MAAALCQAAGRGVQVNVTVDGFGGRNFAAEFLPQLEAYQDWSIFAFDGPHYLSTELVQDLVAAGVGPH